MDDVTNTAKNEYFLSKTSYRSYFFFYTFNKAKDSGIIKTVYMTLYLLKSKLKTEFNIGAYI